jgi:hypothetical protein
MQEPVVFTTSSSSTASRSAVRKYRLCFLLQAITCQCSEDRSVSVYRKRQSTAITAGPQLLLACKLKLLCGSYVGSGIEISRGRELNEQIDDFVAVYVQFPWLFDQSAEPIVAIALISSGIQDGLEL